MQNIDWIKIPVPIDGNLTDPIAIMSNSLAANYLTGRVKGLVSAGLRLYNARS